MSKTTDRMPGTRQEQITMVRKWIGVFTEDTKDAQGIEFGFGDSGKTVYFPVQIENDGKKGRWYRRLFRKE